MLTYGVPESPFGGVKQSGIGRVNGEQGLRSYCHTQSILIDRFGARNEPLWFPLFGAQARAACSARCACSGALRSGGCSRETRRPQRARGGERDDLDDLGARPMAREAAARRGTLRRGARGAAQGSRCSGVSVVEERFTRGFAEDGLGVTPPPPDALAPYLQQPRRRRRAGGWPSARRAEGVEYHGRDGARASPTTRSSSAASRRT